jgi:CDP-diacylglycerol--glycerol-3-phosphate 3-phosphatidyltransferase
MLTTTLFILFASRGIIPVIPVIIMVCRDIDRGRLPHDRGDQRRGGGGRQMMGKFKTVTADGLHRPDSAQQPAV